MMCAESLHRGPIFSTVSGSLILLTNLSCKACLGNAPEPLFNMSNQHMAQTEPAQRLFGSSSQHLDNMPGNKKCFKKRSISGLLAAAWYQQRQGTDKQS